jgi:hypothetical protein
MTRGEIESANPIIAKRWRPSISGKRQSSVSVGVQF